MAESKTILEWLNEIPHPEIRERAVKNFHACNEPDFFECRLLNYDNLKDALWAAFYFSDTPEDHDFWFHACEKEYDQALALLSPSTPSDLERAIELLKQTLPFVHHAGDPVPLTNELYEFLKGK